MRRQQTNSDQVDHFWGIFKGEKNGNNSVDQTYHSRQKEKKKNAKKSPKMKTLHRE